MNERVVVLMLVILAATSAHAQSHRYQNAFNRDVPYGGGTVTIAHQFGSVSIRTSSGSQVSVRASISASDPEFGQQIRVTAEPEGRGVTIRTAYPERTGRKENFSYSVELDVTVPANAPLRVTNRFGSVQAAGIAGGSTIVNSHGSITLREARGAQSVENSFGSITARDIAGDLNARNSHGSININGVRGNAEVANRFGSVHVTDVERDATVTNANGSVQVRDLRAAAKVVNSFGTTDVDGVAGTLRVDGSHSRVKVRNVSSSAQVSTTFGAIDVENVQGTLRVTNNNGSVKVEDIRSDTTVRTSFASATLENIGGAVDVENQNGSIVVSGLAAGSGCKPISLRTSFSPIKVDLRANASYAVSARTTYGRITSAIPIASAVTSAPGESVVGTIGGGGCKLELINKNGNITIERE